VEQDPDLVRNAPHSTRTKRVDETLAARRPVVRWQPPEAEQQAAD
jgi:glycine dehydrogenase subunit 2